MRRRQEIKIMILGDHSLCFEHVVRSYYNLKSGQNPKCILDECEMQGFNTTIDKKPVNLTLRVAPTRTGMSRVSMDTERTNDYKRRMDDIDVILLCYYKNNSKTLHNVRTKYLEEIKEYFPKIPYFLCGVNIDESVDGCISSFKETINIQDRWLKRDLEVSDKEAKKTARKIKSHGPIQCSILCMRDDSLEANHDESQEEEEEEESRFEYDLDKCRSVKTTIDKVAKYIMKRKNAPCIFPFRP